MDKKYIVALELSGTQVKGAVASLNVQSNGAHGAPTIEAVAACGCEECVQYGRVQNIITATKTTNQVIQDLQCSPALADGRITGTYVALAGRSLASERTTAEITLPTEMEITDHILENLYNEAAKMVSQNKRVLCVIPRKYVIDNQTMTEPVGVLGSRIKGEFTLVTCNPTNQRNLELVLNDRDRMNLDMKGYVVTPLALADMILDEEEKQLGCMLVDLGYQTTTISIYKDRTLQYLVTLPMGSHNITRDISASLNVTLEKAETMKCTYGDATPATTHENSEIERINSLVAARAYEIAANIAANIDYANLRPADLPAGYILTGRGALLRNFDRLLSSQTKMRTRIAQLPENLKIASDDININPDQYMSLIAVLLRVCRNSKSANCVEITHPAAEEPETPAKPEERMEQAPAREQTRAAAQPYQPQQPSTETVHNVGEKWDVDDPEVRNEETQTSQKPGKKKKKSIIDSLKKKVFDIMSADPMDDDADIEN